MLGTAARDAGVSRAAVPLFIQAAASASLDAKPYPAVVRVIRPIAVLTGPGAMRQVPNAHALCSRIHGVTASVSCITPHNVLSARDHSADVLVSDMNSRDADALSAET